MTNILTILTNDCLVEIFQHFKDDHQTLYKSIFVNKIFCELAIPLLWRNPFAFIQKLNNKILVIRTYLCFINTHYFRYELLKLPKPYFEYYKFLREFELSSFQEGLREFIRHELKLKSSTNINKKINKIIKLFNEQLGNLLLNKDNHLNHLNVHYTDISRSENQLNLCSLNDIDDVLLNINKLSLEFSVLENSSKVLIELIIRKKNNLQHLIISNKNTMNVYYNMIIKLLESQQRLITLEIPALWISTSTLEIFEKFSCSLTFLKIKDDGIKCSTFFSLLDILYNLRKFEAPSLYFHDNDFLNSLIIPVNKRYKLEYLNFTEPILLRPQISYYRLVFEIIKAISNIVIPNIYLRQ
ncbi:hypothetical protein C1645_841587 [Glomus cerebriforme]|uniref:F-box domain-containing protein n=1 Tax=Glomus cerebriforme TaxID=658196 RepID=A0A397S9S6_9GLOM|nr:hypothetical protein C1645_841634 [Glomus cerebriforme]RIA79074.1 hypothetical protein C1645_841587 [Glomus cerebriforme]